MKRKLAERSAGTPASTRPAPAARRGSSIPSSAVSAAGSSRPPSALSDASAAESTGTAPERPTHTRAGSTPLSASTAGAKRGVVPKARASLATPARNTLSSSTSSNTPTAPTARKLFNAPKPPSAFARSTSGTIRRGSGVTSPVSTSSASESSTSTPRARKAAALAPA
jgi:hypothetical protein